jgi:hypothetical protein
MYQSIIIIGQKLREKIGKIQEKNEMRGALGKL